MLENLWSDWQEEIFEGEAFNWQEEQEFLDKDDFIGADDEDINALISNYKERKKFDDGVRSLAQNDDEYSFLKFLDNY